MPRGKLAGDSSPAQLGLWIAISEWLAKFPLFWWILIILVIVRNIFKHYLVTLTIIGVGILWYLTGSDIVTVLEVTGIISFIIISSVIWLMGGNWKTPYYYLRLKYNWRKAMIGSALKDREHPKRVPEYYRVRPVSGGLTMRVDMRKCGRGVLDLAAEENEVAEVLGAYRATTGKYKPGVAQYTVSWNKEVNFITPRESQKAMSEAGADGDRSKIVIGKLQGGGPAFASMLVSLLVVGVPGSGKTTIFKAICQGLRRQKIEHEFYVIDPKGGIALQELEHAPNTVAYTKSGQGAKTVIGKAYAEMQRRFDVCRELGVDELPNIGSKEFPAQIILIDELLRLPDELTTADVANPLAEILANGRAVGVVVDGASQLAQVDALGRIRDLFGQRICLRTSSPDMTDATLGKRAELNGAKCSLIPASTPGVGYIFSEEENGIRRFRSVKPEGSFVEGPVVLNGPSANRPYALYKMYNALGTPWRYGITDDPDRRFKQYASTTFWFMHADQNRTTIDWYSNKEEAARAETIAIDADQPVHNEQGRKRLDSGNE